MTDDQYNLMARERGHAPKSPAAQTQNAATTIERLECMILKYVTELDIRMASRGLQVERDDLEMLRLIREKYGGHNA